VFHIRKLVIREEGQALAEFALVLPVLMLIIFGIVEFGRGFNYWNNATQISAEGARFAIVNRKPDPNNIASLQSQLLSQGSTTELRSGGSTELPTPAHVCISFPNGTANVGDPVQVTMTFTYHWLGVLDNVSKLIDKKKGFTAATTFTSSSTMRLEAPPTNYGAGCA
jgi:Flp pilus assembly protein TadG